MRYFSYDRWLVGLAGLATFILPATGQAQRARESRTAVAPVSTRLPLAPPPADVEQERMQVAKVGAAIGVFGGIGYAVYTLHNGPMGDIGLVIGGPLIIPLYAIVGGVVGVEVGRFVGWALIR
jgi:hypothetical protein